MELTPREKQAAPLHRRVARRAAHGAGGQAQLPGGGGVHLRCSRFGGALAATSVTFVSRAALEAGMPEKLGLRRRAVAVRDTRHIGKKDLKLNDYTPRIDVDPQTYEVRAGGLLLTCEPARVLPLTQRYFLF